MKKFLHPKQKKVRFIFKNGSSFTIKSIKYFKFKENLYK